MSEVVGHEVLAVDRHVALFLLHGIRMRVVMLTGTLLWIVNNVLSGSIGGTALELTILVVNCSTIWRLRAAAKG